MRIGGFLEELTGDPSVGFRQSHLSGAGFPLCSGEGDLGGTQGEL